MEVISGLPHLPGVYRMLNAAGEVLYVGKALDLKKRVASYFQKTSGVSPRIQHMVAQIARVETTVTRSEGEALLLENNLIKALAPRYNILFRDDKSYPYLIVTGSTFPQLGFHRGPLDARHRYYGPFPGAGAVRESIQLMQKVFRIRTCDDTVFSNRSRPCLLHQIRRCTAPCVGLVSVEDYAEDVRGAELFLSGKEDEVLERLVSRMEEASRRMDYEAAAVLRDQITALRKVRERQFVAEDSDRDADVIACVRVGGVTCVNLVMIRGGHHLGDKNFFPRNAEEASDEAVLETFVGQHYLRHAIPRQVIVGARLDPAPLVEALTAQAGRRVQVTVNPTGARRVWLEMACKNARLGAEQAASLHSTQEARLTALQSTLELTDPPQRIECFDVSHTMGEAPVASCVVYERTAMQKSEYRRYNIAGVQPGDDYGAMREVLTRRYRRLVAGEGRRPDLVLIDGGRGQLGVAVEVFSELGLADVPLVAVAKGEERKPGLEQLFLPRRPVPVVLGADHPALHLVQQIRDEAHRFAITGHRARRAKVRSTSRLEAITGVGARRRQRLLSRFGGLRGLLAASVDDLAAVDGISRSLAEKIYQELH
jgi:excinuclease ABC subunit C